MRPVYGFRYTKCSVLFRFGVQFDGNMCLLPCCNVDCLEAISITGGMSLLLPPCSPPLHGKLLIGYFVTYMGSHLRRAEVGKIEVTILLY